MKLASLNQGRDGQLIVVSRDLRLAVYAHDIAPTCSLPSTTGR
ncbi:fumarylacetoacetate hydrolase family protein [Photobacterium aphoticum]|uniref:Fumarylacetoacetate hydrolase family protein n=1 Tax=Photobacterium aphoticum TaxID=754436 RepID=A0A090QNF4_9GAMM|nr:fumarylacetoacetate hydrolase family protein [Photobacterium aphoticum]